MSKTVAEIDAEIAKLMEAKQQAIQLADMAMRQQEEADKKREWEVNIIDGGMRFTVRTDSSKQDELDTFARSIPNVYLSSYTRAWTFEMKEGNHLIDYVDLHNVELKNRSIFETSYNSYINTPDLGIGYVSPNFTLKPRNTLVVNRCLSYDLRTVMREDKTRGIYTLPQHVATQLIADIGQAKRDYPDWNIIVSPSAETEMKAIVSKRDTINTIAKLENLPSHQFQFVDNRTLMPFQTVSQKFSELVDHRFILADEMGLGKTLQAIGIAMRNNFRTLCIVPANVIPNWHRELTRATGKEPLTFRGTSPSPLDIMELVVNKSAQFNIIGWSSLSNTHEHVDESTGVKRTVNEWINYINLSKFDFIVIDEAHRMKNETAQRSKAMLQLQAPRIMGMSGTPIENRPREYFNILHLLYPDIFSNRADFEVRYTDGKNGARNVAQLQNLLQPIMLRRKKKDVLKDLPPIIRMQDFTQLRPKELKAYQRLVMGILDTYDELGNNTGARQLKILEMLMRLKQFTSALKVARAIELAQDAYDGATDYKKVIIFSQFRPIARRIARKLGVEALHFDGTVDVYERQSIVDNFQNDVTKKYLVCTIGSAQEGLNITAAGTVIFVDLMWTPSAHHQAEARAYGRLSDAHGVEAHYLLCESTFDEEIWKLLEDKMAVIEQVVDGVTTSRNEESIVSSVIKSLFTMRKR